MLSTVLDVLRTSNLLVLPYLVGFTLAAPISLRIWLAAQYAQLPESPPPSAKQHLRKFFLVLFPIVTLELAFLYVGGLFALSLAYQIMYFGICTVFTANVLRVLFGSTELYVYRNTGGKLLFRYLKSANRSKHIVTAIVAYVVASGISVATIATPWEFPRAITSTGLVVFVSAMYLMKKVSIPRLIICFVTYVVFVAAITSFALFVSPYFKGYGSVPEKDSPEAKALLLQMRQIATILTPLCSALCGAVISLAYRFDYQRHVNTVDNPPKVTITAVPPLREEHGTGVVVPPRVPTSFSKVYFVTALVAWSMLQIAFVTTWMLFDWQFLKGIDNADVFLLNANVFVLIMEMPMLCIILMAVAAIRGEAKQLWRYQENWCVKPNVEGEIALPADRAIA